jgi:hypothetical protein
VANGTPGLHLLHVAAQVDWYPWGEEALSKARQENKPIFLSVGYATCHWCAALIWHGLNSVTMPGQVMKDTEVLLAAQSRLCWLPMALVIALAWL